MIVTDNGDGFDARTHQEVHQHGLYFGLTRLEVIAGNKDLSLLGQLDQAGHKSVLRRSIDVRALGMRGSKAL